MSLYFRHHVIPLHEWRQRINPKVTRWDKIFNAPDNVVWLTREQHTEVHRWLWEHYGKKQDWLASIMIEGNMSEEVRRFAAKHRDTSYMKTPEYRESVAASKRGKATWNKGIVGQLVSDDTKKKHRDYMLGRVRGPYKRKTSQSSNTPIPENTDMRPALRAGITRRFSILTAFSPHPDE